MSRPIAGQIARSSPDDAQHDTRSSALARWRDKAAAGAAEVILRRVLGHKLHSRLTVTFPTGVAAHFGAEGEASQAQVAHLSLHSMRVVWKALRRGSIGFAESYLDGDVDSPDMVAVLKFFVGNKAAFMTAGRGLFRVRRSDKRRHAASANTRAGSRRNIAAHYDLGNGFYGLWLDAGMTYSSAIFRNSPNTFDGMNVSLEAAQAEKNRSLIRALDLQPGHSVLETGCGWGGFAEAAALAGADVTAITISRAQEGYARTRLAAAGLSDRARVRFVDYRDCDGQFDRLASVEMIEAVGEAHWSDYFRMVHDRLKPGGVAVIQAIVMEEEHFAHYRAKADFIQTYIFPGGMLTTEAAMRHHASACGLTFERVERFGLSYAETLKRWRLAFEAAWPDIAALGFDERFRRMWRYYLMYCEAGFGMGMINVGHYVLRKPVNV